MLLLDVNVLLYAFRKDAPRHTELRDWLARVVNDGPTYGVADLVLSSFIRIVTNPRIYREPTALETALAFVSQVRDRPQCARVAPGPRHWTIFADLCRRADAKGNLVADAYLAALAIEHGCEWITTDRDFARFPGLRWRHPLD